MTDIDRLAFYDRLFRATAFDNTSEIWWRLRHSDSSVLDFYVNCNDIFAWACSDCELVTPDNIHILEASIRDCAAVSDHTWGPTLFVARVRGQRPQGAVMKDMPIDVVGLFDAVGPKRPVDFANPYAHPEDGGAYEYKKEHADGQ